MRHQCKVVQCHCKALYIVWHAVAHEWDADRWPDDAKRPLTSDGEKQFRLAAGGILRLVPEVGCMLSSPFVRAWRTAEILEQRGWPTLSPGEELEPDYPPRKVLDALARYAYTESVAIVGHRPPLHELVSYLLGDDGACVQIEKGGAVYFRFDGLPQRGIGSPRWLLTPRALRGG